MVIVFACPGQGAQTPGFLAEWLTDATSVELLAGLSEIAGIDLAQHGTTSDAETIKDTAVAQPLIVAASLLAHERLLREAGDTDATIGTAGHSVGEVAAASIAGILSPSEAMQFVTVRAREMAVASAATPTGMSATIGKDEDALMARLAELGLTPANYNGGGQIVVAGPLDRLAELQADPPKGFRIIPLATAGAFHTEYMRSARETLEAAARDFTTADPTMPIWTNRDGTVVTSGADYLDLLVSQVTSPVRWDRVMEGFAADGVTGVIELLPGGTLAGLVKRNLRGTPTIAIKTPADLPAAVELLTGASHTTTNE